MRQRSTIDIDIDICGRHLQVHQLAFLGSFFEEKPVYNVVYVSNVIIITLT